MKPTFLRAIVIAVYASVTLTVGATAHAAEPDARARIFATLPDWTGIWENEGAVAVLAGKPLALPKLLGKPPYTAKAEKLYGSMNLVLGAGGDTLTALGRALPALKGV